MSELSVAEKLKRFPSSTRKNLYLIRAVDGLHYLGLRDEGVFIEPLMVRPVQRKEDPNMVDFHCGMAYLFTNLADPEYLSGNPLAVNIRDEHVMCSAYASDTAALLYFETKENFLKMLMEQTAMRNVEAAAANGRAEELKAASEEEDGDAQGKANVAKLDGSKVQ